MFNSLPLPLGTQGKKVCISLSQCRVLGGVSPHAALSTWNTMLMLLGIFRPALLRARIILILELSLNFHPMRQNKEQRV